jgi:DNA-binding MarR family transcriptional regulator
VSDRVDPERAAPDPSDLDRRLADALDRLGRALHVAGRHEAGRHQLSPLQARVLQRLAAPGSTGSWRVKELARELDVGVPTMSEAVVTLVAKGLVSRRPDPADGRANTLGCTVRGRAVARRLDQPADVLVPALTDMAATDKATALGLILDLIADLVEREVIDVARTCTTCRFFQRDGGPDRQHPHRCALLAIPLATAELRIDCPDHARPA